MCIDLVRAEGTGRMQLPPRPCAASWHGNQQHAKSRNELKSFTQLRSKEEIFHLAQFRGWSIQEEQPGCRASPPWRPSLDTWKWSQLSGISIPCTFTYSTALQKAHLFPYVMPSVPQWGLDSLVQYTLLFTNSLQIWKRNKKNPNLFRTPILFHLSKLDTRSLI